MTTPAPRLQSIETASTFLFVPATRPDRFEKATLSGAGQIILDLEDAVAPADKDQARHHVAEWLGTHVGSTVRINGSGTAWHADDVRMVADRDCAVMLPKAESAEELKVLARVATRGLLGLVETARGLLSSSTLADACTRLAFGNVDLAAELGLDPAHRQVLAPLRMQLVVSAAAAQKPAPVDGVTTSLRDTDALREDARAARRQGFTGKLCIHPAQVSISEDALRPTDDEIAWATSVVAVRREGATAIDGQMIDEPVVSRARALLLRSSTPRQAT